MKKVIVCTRHRANPDQPSCAARGSLDLAAWLEREIAARGWDIRLERFDCLGRCEDGPNLRLAPGGPFHQAVTAAQRDALLLEIERFCQVDKTDCTSG